MEMNEFDRSLTKNTGKRIASAVINGVAEAAVSFVKDVIPDSYKRNQPEQPRPVPRTIIVVEDNKKIDAVRAELRALKSTPVNQIGQSLAQTPHVSFSNLT